MRSPFLFQMNAAKPINPLRAGIGLRFDHYNAVRDTKPDVSFLEIHTENFFGGGYHPGVLEELTGG